MPDNTKTYLIQAALFITTFFTCTYFSAAFLGLPVSSYTELFKSGLRFSIPFLSILTVHEFGHYITSRIYNVKVTLPYYIPFIGIVGTLGAFIRIKSMPKSRKEFFDIGIAGPLAGFVVAFGILIYAFTNLPSLDYLYNIHEDYKQFGAEYAEHVYKDIPNDSIMVMAVGDNLMFTIMEELLVEDKSLIPHAYEMIHYPLLMAGYLALFFTALNLLPIGQLDGGHVLYGLLGRRRHKFISDIVYTFLVLIGGVGLFKSPLFGDSVPIATFENFIIFTPIYLVLLYLGFFSRLTKSTVTNFLITVVVFISQYIIVELWPDLQGFLGYMVFAFIISRFLGTAHPPAETEKPLSTGRKILGWFALLIFILCFSIQPIYFVSN